jgi:ornithine carbamoyltransferase
VRRSFLDIAGEDVASFAALLDRARFWKKAVKSGIVPRPFDATPSRTSPRVLAMIFQKPSNRTRVSFELAMHHMGGKALYLSPQEIGLGKREAVKDVAAVLGRYVDAIMARVFAHADIVALDAHAGVPVVNGLSDLEHPCQALGDLLTIVENGGAKGTIVAYIGDGNNVCHSLMLAAALAGMPFRWIGPKGYEPEAAIIERARGVGGTIELGYRIEDAAKAAFVYTDVWASMGEEAEAEERKRVFAPFRLDGRILSIAPEAKILHCLPAHRGEEITDEVVDHPRSVVIDQAENRLYAQMAVLERAIEG